MRDCAQAAMNRFPHIKAACATDKGRRRENNEDNSFCDARAGLFAVADGMGGGDDGEVASAAVVAALKESVARRKNPGRNKEFPAGALLDGVADALGEASAAIRARTEEKGLKSCGSTCVGFQLDATDPAHAVAFHAGDSRLYSIRGGRASRITRDHSPAALMGVDDENDLNPMFRGVVLRAVGIENSVEIERTPFEVAEGDILVLCSDGLYKMVPDYAIAQLASLARSPKDAARALVDAANAAGGVDNITALAVFVGRLPPPVAAAAVPGGRRQAPQSEPDDAPSTVAGTGCYTMGSTSNGSGISAMPKTVDPVIAPAPRRVPAKAKRGPLRTRLKWMLRRRLGVVLLCMAAGVAVCTAAAALALCRGCGGGRQAPEARQ